jgi:hypothetical protein
VVQIHPRPQIVKFCRIACYWTFNPHFVFDIKVSGKKEPEKGGALSSPPFLLCIEPNL